jgi:CHAD domain-containing protein
VSGAVALGAAPAELARWVQRCHDARDIDAAHGLRVLTRRIDAWLRLGRWRVLRDDLRWLRRTAEEARDLDVLIEAAPGGRATARLRRRRAKAGEVLVRQLDDPRAAAIVAALGHLPGVDRGSAREGVRRAAAAALARDDTSPEGLHALRRSLRRVRHSLEWLGEDATPLVEVQTALGAVSDAFIGREGPSVSPLGLMDHARARWGETRPFVAKWV